MKIVVWTVSVLLAVVFLAAGGMKVLTATADLQQSSGGVPIALMRIAGTAEILGALGLVLPAVTRIAPALTPIAAGGLVVVMVGATITNIVTGAYGAVPMTVVLGLVAAFVAWARAGRYAVAPRTRSRAATAS